MTYAVRLPNGRREREVSDEQTGSERVGQLSAKASAALNELRSLISEQKDALQVAFDSRSEKWQEGEKGDAMQAQIDRLASFEDELAVALDALEEFDLDEE